MTTRAKVDTAALRALLADGRCLCSHSDTDWSGVAALLDEVERLRAVFEALDRDTTHLGSQARTHIRQIRAALEQPTGAVQGTH